MADHFEVVKNAPGFGSKFGDSIKGIFFGFIMLVLAFPVLWWGENRQNLAEFVEKGQQIEANAAPAVAAQTLVKTTGKLTSEETAIDDEYLAEEALPPALKLERSVEIYAWTEHKETRTENNKEITTYDYKKEWTHSPENSAEFYEPNGHQNPVLNIQSMTSQVTTAKVGVIEFDSAATEFYDAKELAVTDAMVAETVKAQSKVAQGKIYLPVNTGETEATYPGVDAAPSNRNPASNPVIGDVRLSYQYFPSNVNGSVVGDWDGSKVVGHVYGKSDTFLGAYPGSLPEFQSYLQTQHTVITWIIRVVSFLMMWIGLNMLIGPILLVIGSVPILGDVGKGLISLVTGGIAFVLWLLTLILANLWLILLVLALLFGGVMYYRKKHAASQPNPV